MCWPIMSLIFGLLYVITFCSMSARVPLRVIKAYRGLQFCCVFQVFIECSGTEDDTQKPFQDTNFYRLLDEYQNTICIHVTLPPFTPGMELVQEYNAYLNFYKPSLLHLALKHFQSVSQHESSKLCLSVSPLLHVHRTWY